VLHGHLDLEAEAKAYRLRMFLDEARRSGQPRIELQVIEKAVGEDADAETFVANYKFELLKEHDPEAAIEYGNRLVGSLLKNSPAHLHELARSVVGPPAQSPDQRFAKLALVAALRADELVKQRNAAIAATLGSAYAANGEVAKTISAQERAA